MPWRQGVQSRWTAPVHPDAWRKRYRTGFL